MILSGIEIKKQIKKRNIIIQPFDKKQLNPNSYNLKLNNKLLVYKNHLLDMKKENKYEEIYIPKSGLLIEPGKIYLGRTYEYTETKNLVPMIEGRCHGKGTKILMYNKNYKNIEDIKENDLVMGTDSKPKKVIKTYSGFSDLFEIKQSRGITYITNGNHLLNLYCTYDLNKKYKKGNYYNIEVNEFNKMCDYYKTNLRGYKKEVEFIEENIKIDPYVLGIWLGDGNNNKVVFTIYKKDYEIVDYLKLIYPEINIHSYKENTYTITLSKKGGIPSNPIVNKLREYNLLNNKHIPIDYLKSSKKTRLNVLAGLIDTDGYMVKNRNYIELCTIYKKLCDDIIMLCNSLGLQTSLNITKSKRYKKEYGNKYRIFIKGDIEKIPCKCKRKWDNLKKEKAKQNKTLSKLSVKNIGPGEYFGFEIDSKDGLYFLEDNTVTHNSSMGRLGLFIHVTAGFGDVGFCGYWTLEIVCVNPIIIYPYIEICQIYYHQVSKKHENYFSKKYQFNNDVQPSLLFKDFENEK